MAALSNKKRKSLGAGTNHSLASADPGARVGLDVALFSQRVVAMRERVSRLFRSAQHGATPELLLQAFDELQQALEELQAAEEALRSQSQQQLNTRETVDTERRHYAELFEHAPVAYLVTSIEGTIRQANEPAAALFQTQARQLVGRSLALFVPEGSRRSFRARVAQLSQTAGPHQWYTQLQPREGRQLDALLLIGVAFDSSGRAAALRWLVHQIEEPASFPHNLTELREREVGGS